MLLKAKTDGIGLNTVFKETLGNNGNNGLKMPDSTLLFCP